MIWAVIGVGYRDIIVLPKTMSDEYEGEDGKKAYRMNAQHYLSKCLYPRVQRWKKDERIFMHDGAKCHQAKKVLGYLNKSGASFIADWPARSCDLNPIENLWALLQRKVSDRKPRNVDDLCKIVKEEFDTYSEQIVQNLVMSYEARLKECIRVGGLSI